jgi:uncharacterized repeat protein (TIGR03803 family)
MNHKINSAFRCRSQKKATTLMNFAFAAFIFTFCLIAAQPSLSQTESILYSTTLYENPDGGVIMDSQGNLCGTTTSSGINDRGEVFKLTAPAEPGAEWTPTILHAFTGQPDGQYPSGNLVLDNEGNLYGLAQGGSQGFGVIYEISAAGVETIFHNFKLNKITAYDPSIGLVRDSKGNFFGATSIGGAAKEGTVYEVSASGVETVLYNFQGGSDGYEPFGVPILDSQGNLYGTTWKGGPNHAGTVFKLTPAGVKTILYSFAASPTDGQYPYAGVVMDTKGNLFGTTGYGGANGYGTVFALTAAGVEKILYSFKGGHSDGQLPEASLILDSHGNLYGTTAFDDNHDGPFGTVFEVTPAGKETVLHRFTSDPDGYNPLSNLIMDSQGNLYGTTYLGGTIGSGTVFEVTP